MDKTIIGGTAGFMSGIIVGTLSQLLYSVSLCNLCLIAIGGGLFHREMLARAANLPWTILGWIGHLTLSFILGIILVFLLYFTGKDFAILKGALFGTVGWYINIAIISPLAGYIPPSPDAAGLMILLGYHILFGVLTAGLIVWLAKRQHLEL